MLASEADFIGSCSQSQEISIPTSKVGIVIGKGGKNIKELQANSRCKVKILQTANYTEETKILIEGTPENISNARQKILDLINDVSFQRGNRISEGFKPLSSFSQVNDNISSWDHQIEHQYELPLSETTDKPSTSGFLNWSAIRSQSQLAAAAKLENAFPFEKKFYVENELIANMPLHEVEEYRQSLNKITVVDLAPDYTDNESILSRKIPNPVKSFNDCFQIYPEIMEKIKYSGFTQPSPIQCQAWPIILSGIDCIGIAQTGTGKTLAFLLPILIHVSAQDLIQNPGPRALILAPTRELAQQIEREVGKFTFKHIRSVCLYGGASRREQVKFIEKGVEIIIATPGRLIDLATNGIVNLETVTFVVLDEADKMLDMGFEPDIRKILFRIREDRQVVMTSATWPISVRRLANKFMKTPMQINVGSLNLTSCKNVTQQFLFLREYQKNEELRKFLLSMNKDEKAIVFVGRKTTADDLSCDFMMENFLDGSFQTIHGDREQADRETALAEFRNGIARVLIATDVASRGLDVTDISYVVNYDFPKDIEEYVHRIGRTGRAGKTGTSLTFMTDKNCNLAQDLIDILKEASQEIPEELVRMAEFRDSRRLEQQISGFDCSQNDTAYTRNLKIGYSSKFRGQTCYKCNLAGHIARNCVSYDQ